MSAPMHDGPARDAQALKMREAGAPFRTIAKELGFDRSSDANAAFRRALRVQPPRIRARIQKTELVRLAALADHERSRTDVTEQQRRRRLGVVERLRKSLAD